jgi:sugar lactone lactonase YvrE
MGTGQVFTAASTGALELVCEVPGTPSGLGWLPDGRLLVVSMDERRVYRLESTGLVVHADLSELIHAELNDMVVDAEGRAYVSNFGYDAATETPRSTGIVSIEPDGTIQQLPLNLWRPNGMAITADQSTFLVAETRVHRLTAFDLRRDPLLTEPRLVADVGADSWADGICVDEQNAIWVGDPMRSRCVRIVEGQGIVEVIETEVPAIACMLGGADRRTLFITEAVLGSRATSARDRRGRVECVTVAVPGAGWP